MAEIFFCIVLAFACVSVRAQDATNTERQNENSLDEFSRQQREANWPALFQKVGVEFGVPADVLAGISLVQTRWFHFTAPTNQASSGVGQPRPFGIMGLWDDDINGHNLAEAAKLIGQTPDDLKNDPLQNCRGAAALLKKFYQENPLPNGTGANDIESWRNAIAKYSGKPEGEAQLHAVGIYEAIAEGSHELGIDWPGHPVNLEPMLREVMKKYDAGKLLGTGGFAEATNESHPAPASPIGPRSTRIKKFRALMAKRTTDHSTRSYQVEGIDWKTPVITMTLALVLLGGWMYWRRRG